MRHSAIRIQGAGMLASAQHPVDTQILLTKQKKEQNVCMSNKGWYVRDAKNIRRERSRIFRLLLRWQTRHTHQWPTTKFVWVSRCAPRHRGGSSSAVFVITTTTTSAANVYLALLLHMSLIYYSQKSYTIRYVQLSHFTDEEAEA